MRKLLISIVLLGCITPTTAFEIIVQPKLTSSATQKMQATKAGRESLRVQRMQPLSRVFLNKINTVSGYTCTDIKAVANGARVIDCGPETPSASEKQSILKAISQLPDVNYAEENGRVHAMGAGAATNYNTTYQWDMTESMVMTTAGYPESTFFGDNFVNAWNNLSQNSGTGVVVAVLDTGYTQHPAFGFEPGGSLTGSAMESGLTANESGYGYDFITSCAAAGTTASGNPAPGCSSSTTGRRNPQPNALDLGDSFTTDKGVFRASSWHGTLVQGTVNGQGVSGSYPDGSLGGASGSLVLPVRVLGKGGGSDADIINGMYWAAGFDMAGQGVSGVTTNTAPAKVLNMSLGGEGPCTTSYQQAVTAIKNDSALHSIIVVAAGNESSDVSTSVPANCPGVVSVAALGPTNLLAFYTNYGDTTIAASGGDTWVNSSIGGVYWPTYDSTTTYYPVSPSNFIWAGQNKNGGTSTATPHVAAALAMLLSVDSSLSQSQIIDILQASATIVGNVGCSTYWSQQCLTQPVRLNAANALRYVQESILVLSATNAEFNGTTLTTATITNNNTSAIVLGAVTPTISIGDFGSAATCPGGGNTVAANGGTCTISVTANSSGIMQGYITVSNESGVNMAIVGVSGTTIAGNPPAPVGGCTAVKDGEDYSLMLLLGIMLGVYLYRRHRAAV